MACSLRCSVASSEWLVPYDRRREMMLRESKGELNTSRFAYLLSRGKGKSV
jgi:hypothetical protein